MITSKQLKEYSKQCITTIDKNQLIDISTIEIDSTLSKPERVLSYLEQVKNPYCFMCDDTPVRICFKEDGISIDDAVKRFLSSKHE